MQHLSSHLWLSRFAIRFMQIRPAADWRRAVARGVCAYERASSLNPEAVAQVFARGREVH
jgi:hypothetical protein